MVTKNNLKSINKKTVDDSQLEKWYVKSEPLTQIKFMKLLATTGLYSKTQIKDKIDLEMTTVDTIMKKMEDKDHNLIQRVRKEFQNTSKSSAHILYSLTDKAINILLKGHFENSTRPYLTKDEVQLFIDTYDEMFADNPKNFPEWKKSKIKRKDIPKIYINSNDKLYEEFKEKHIIKKLAEQILKLNEDIKNNMYDTFLFETRPEKKKQ